MAVPEALVPAEYRGGHVICLRRAAGPPGDELYRASIREPLPNIPVSLRSTDQDVALRLQPVLDECYRRGRYHSLNYRLPAVPRLSDDDERWADAVLRAKGLR